MSCSAPNCTNSHKKGIRVFRFPSEPERRKRWSINCRRDCWTPGPSSRICEIHFEEDQFEANRADGWRKLKQNAIPTLFNVPNPPKPLESMRKKGIGIPKAHFSYDCDSENIPSTSEGRSESVNEEQQFLQLTAENAELKKKLKELEIKYKTSQESYNNLKQNLSTFLSDEQINFAGKNKKAIAKWSNDGILKGLKLRFGLGKHGYNFLRSTGYPAPSYSTLNNHIKDIQMPHGILQPVINLLKTKTDNMTPLERECCLLVDEMEISSSMDFNISSMSFIGQTTLGEGGVGNHCMVVMLRGLQIPWKQIVAHEITGAAVKGNEMKKLLLPVIQSCHSAGLNIKAVTSDMASCNKSFWNSVDVEVSRQHRRYSFTVPGISEPIYTLADVPHLLKNLRSATLAHCLYIPDSIRESQDLPTKIISSCYLKELWVKEMDNDSGLRSLHHLRKEHLYPSHYNTMNVALAVQFFSIKTAAALEKAVVLKQIHVDALTLAWWVRLVCQWFELMTSRNRKSCITKRNSDKKISFLKEFVDVVQEVEIGKGWKPLNTGLIMSTLSVVELATASFERGYDFFMPGRLTQDALENVFSQVRRRAGLKPTALSVKKAVRSICISQFICDIRNTNYMADSDYNLINFSNFKENVPQVTANASPLKVKKDICSGDQDVQASTSTPVSVIESNDIYYIAGAVVKSICTKFSICDSCVASLTGTDDCSQELQSAKILTNFTNMGGLKHPSISVYKICQIVENIFQMNVTKLIEKQMPMGETFIQDVLQECVNHFLPDCCNVKRRIILSYLVTRGIAVTKHQQGKRKLSDHYSSIAKNKKACSRK